MNKIQKLLLTVICLFAVTATWGYDITVITDEAHKETNHGYLTTNVNTPGTSTLVTITAHPNEGYYVNTPVVTLVASGTSANARRIAPGIGDTITPTLTGPNTYQFSMPNYDVEITATFTACTDINSATVLLTEGTQNTETGHYSQVYDFLTHSPKISSVTIENTPLTEGIDYTVTGLGNFKDVNTNPITLTGIGKYKGTKTINYVISALPISTATINLSGNNFVYDHTQHKPTITHVYLNGQELTQDQDYVNITYSDDTEGGSTNAGTYTITIYGMGNFSGTCEATYTIAKKHISACSISTPSGTSFIYSGSEKELTVTITDGGYTLVEGSGKDYILSGHKQTNVGAYTATITANELNYTGSASVSYTINASNEGYYIDVISDQTYTGSPIEPTVVVKKRANTTADPEHDPVIGAGAYYLVYNNNINVGIATVSAIGKDGYSFMATQTFNIVAKSISGATITLSGFTNTTDNNFTYNGTTQKPTVTVTDGTKQLYPGKDYSLTNDGGINAGSSYTASITGMGNYTGSKTSSTYTIAKKSLTGGSITLSTTNLVYDGSARQPDVTLVKSSDGIIAALTDYDVTYTNNTNVGTPESTDKPTVTVTAKSTGSNFKDNVSTYFTISPKPVSDLTITLSATTFTYNGSEQKPEVTVKDGSTTLTSGTHYDLTWSNEDSKAVGSYTVTITGKGNYSGSVVKSYVINYGTSDDDFHIVLTTPSETFTYDGTAKKPAVTVTKGEGTSTVTLTKDTDYTLEYSNNINAGLATITARGIGNYQFITTFNFTINKKAITSDMATLSGTDFVSASQSFVYNAALQKPTVTIMDGSTKKLVEGTDYTLVNDGGVNVGDYTAAITGIGNYTTGTGGLVKNYSITALSLTGASVTLDPLQSYVYDGTEKRPGVQQVKVGNVVVPAADYTVTYPKDASSASTTNVNAGNNTAEVYINHATGNLSDSKTQKFSITKKPLTSEMITLSSTASNWANNSFTYTGTNQKPTVTVTDGSPSIIAESDYTITNEGGTAVGVYYVTVAATSAGNYSGTIKMPYSIVSDNADNDVTITLGTGDNLVYTGNPITRTITVTKGTSTTPLTINADYEVVYTNNTNVGEATITIMGKGNYHFVKYAYFNISARPMTAANGINIALSAPSFEYNGSTQKPNITVTYTKPDASTATTLVEGTDYTLSNPGATNVGDNYKATISGIGNFSGTMDSPTYAITSKSLTDAEITLYPLTNPVYDGTEKEPAVQKVTLGGQVYTSGYTVGYSYNVNVKTTVETMDHYPTVTIIPDATGNFSGSASTTFTIQPKPLTDEMVTLEYTSVAYDGSAKEPGVTVTDTSLPGTNKTVPSSNYDVAYDSDHTSQGEKSIQITGKNNYSGTITKKYTITGSTGFDVAWNSSTEPAYTYDGTAHEPAVKVTISGTTTDLSTSDYDVAYSNNVNAGTATVSVTGKGNYSGTKTLNYTIAQKEMTNAMVALAPTTFTYNGSIQKPTVTVSDGTLITSNDYTISNEGNINAGNYTVTVTATTTGNYSGSGSQTYTINPLSLNDASTSITLSANSFVYDASAKEPEVLLVKVGDLVVPSASYTVSYSDDHTNVGSPQVTVTANASTNYADAKSQSYSITKRTITSDMVKLNTTNFTYNGTVQKPTVQAVSGYTITSDDIDVDCPNSKDVGVYTVTVTGKAPNNQGTVNLSYSIASNNQSDVNISMAGTDDLTYTGNPITRNITVTKGSGTGVINLTEGTDYTLIYNNNVNKGTATVNVIGKNGYDFVETKTYEIAARPMTSENGITINLSATNFEYNGSVQKPNVTVTYTYIKTGETTSTVATLVEGTDYTLNNPGAVNVSTGNKATITGIGNFSGTMDSPTYEITAKALTDATITLYPLANPIYDGTAKEPAIQKVTVGGQVYTSGYTVSYSNNINVETATVKPTVTVSSDGTSTFSGSASTTFVIQPKPLADDMVTLEYTSIAYDGDPKEPEETVMDEALPSTFASKKLTKGTDYTVSYTTDHTAPGEKAVTITGMGNYTGNVSKKYTIIGASDVDITLPEATYTYNGAEHKPVVTVKKGDNTLTLNTDYTVAYSDNINAGTATITVTGKGNYDFTQTKTFSIAQKAMTNAMMTLSGIPVEADGTYFTYDGTLKKPIVTVSDGTPSIITADDYTISNEGNINAGNYTVTVTASATGNYSGSGSQTYTISPMSITSAEVALSYNSIVFNGSVQKPEVRTVYANGHQLTATTDYTVSWPDADYTNHGTKNVTVTGTSNYKDSRTVQYAIDKKPLVSDMIKIANQNLTYTGSDQAPEVTIEDKIGTTNIIKAADYTLSNPAHSAVGNYEVTLTATDAGNYSGQVTKQYSIVTAGSTGFTVVDIPAQDYTGLALTPALTVYKAGTTSPALELGTDYTAEYSNNINAGTATVTVTGKGNYSGTQTVYFTINPKSLNAAGISVTLSPTSFSYTGTTQKPEVTVKDGASKTLVLNTDYTLVNDGGIANGTYDVIITGQGNYKDVVTPAPSYTIVGQSLTGATVVLNRLDSYVYDGNPKTPGVSEVKVGSTVIPAANYTVSYADNVNAGTATVTVTGTGNCSGTATTTFDITPKTVNSDMITISPTTFNYDGALHKPTTVIVKDGEKTMVEGTTTAPKDYLLSNPGGTEIGAYSVTITGQGNYTGTASKSYAIVANDASGFSINAIAAVTYNGAAQEPAPVVKEGDNTLSSDYYSVAYLNNINAGTAVVTVTGKNGYTFVKSQTFTIQPKSLADGMLILSASDFTYNGNVQKPTPTMTDKNASDVSIITSNDYVITNEGGADVGTYHVVVNGQNNYTGSIDMTFTISQLSLLTATITLATLSSYVYDGTAKTPAVQLVKVGELVVPATAYSVAYTSNIHVGTATVTVTAKTGTNFKDGNTTTFNIEQKEVSSNMITLGGTGFNTTTNSFIYDGSLHTPTVTVMDGMTPMVLDTDYTLTNTGGTDVGDNYTVTIEGKGNYKGYATKQYSIVTAGSTGFTVGAIADQTYTGSALTPKPEVTDGDKVLVENTDYTLSYSNNINAGTNTASVTVTGKGNYSGTQMQTFTILPKPLDADEVTLSFTAATYTGMEIKPVVTVKDGSITLTKDVDFTVAYPADVVSQGEKTVKITGIRNYTTVIGTATTIDKTYTIGKVDISTASVTLESTSYVYDKTEKKPRVLVVSFTNGQIVPSSGYDVAWSQNIDASSLTNVPTVTVTGKDNYTGTTTATFQINPKPVTSNMMTLDPMNFNYNGSTQKPTVTISDKNGGVECITADDYDIVNEGGKEVGNYTVTLKGKRNYTGEAEKQFSILEKDAVLNNFTITLEETSVVYDGAEKKPAVTVKDGDTPLGANDYTVVYTDNVNVGTATVIVTGKGNYAGTKTTTFTITAKQLTEEMVHLSTPTTFTYNGKIQKPTVIVSDGNAMTAIDYTIINDDHSDANTYNVEVIGTHNYTGSVVKPYTISPLSIIGASVTLEALTFTFNTTAQKPAVSEVKVGDLIVPSTDYTVSYPADVTNHGQKMITITAKNNFTREITKDYTISPKPVDEDMIILTSGSYLEYTGEWLKPTVIVKDGGTVMVEGETKDYTLVNDGAVNVGQYTVSIEGHGNYMGGASKVYNIIAAGSAGFTIADIDAVTYDGTAQEPVVAVRDANTGMLLTKDVNYYIIYTNNKNAGTALANVTGIGNYMGTATKTFKINPKTLTEDMVKITGYTLTDGDGFIYNGITQKPTVMVADGSAMTADDYVVVNNGGLNVNEISAPYEVTITGANNYTGSITKTFNILPLDISDAAVTLYQLSNNVYDGTAKTPGVREVVTGANIMVPTVGYDVEYSKNVNAGTAIATVTGKNNFMGTTSTTFTIDKKTVTSSMMTLSEENFTFNGSLQKPTVTVTDIVNEQNIIKTSDYTIINNGGTEVGSYTVTLKGVGNYTGEAVRTYSIVEKDAGTSAFTMSLSTTSVEYNGLPHTPAVTVKDGEKILDATGDYTITYSDNTNAGTATVTVTGRGNYAGTRSATFEITKKPLTAAMVTISGYTTSNGFIYNGSNQKPTVVVRDGSALTASDYVITNNGGTNNGTYHVVVTATGNYSGEIDQTYVIEKKSIEGATVTLYELPSYVYDGTAKKPGVKEVAFGEDVIPTVGYAVTYTNNTNAGMATVTVTGQGNYSGVLTSQFTIACKGLTAEMMVLSNDEYVYNGANQKPAVVLMDGGTEMVLDTDYTLTNEGGISVGQYAVIANGQGNYNGMAMKTFQIISKEIGAFEVTLSTEQVIYNGSEQRPMVTVKDGDVILTAGSQYTVNYTDNINAGTAMVTITGQGEYSGTTTKTFIIKPKPLTEDMVYLSSTTYTYNTLQQKPTVTVSDQSFLTANDYTLTNDGGIDHGDYDVVVIGRNNYTGTVVKQFTIKPLSIENAKVVLYEMASYVYDGTPKNPGVREVIVGNTIVPTSSYTVEISPNVNVGEVIVTVTGLENFTGTATATFDITPKPLSEQMLLLNEEMFYYNGEVQKPVVEIKDGETVLKEEKDYTLVNEGGMEPGTYEVVATGMNNYMGTVTKTYRIERSDISVDITAKDSEGGEFGVTLIVSQISEDSRDVRVTGITIPDKDKLTVMTLTIPATCMAEGVTYTITEIAANAFADVEHMSDLYLPDTEKPLIVGDNAIPASTTVHTTLALLDDYALMPSMGVNFRDNKVMTTVTAKNQYWTFSSGVDVYVPEGVTVYTVQERTSTAVAIVEMTSNALTASGVVMIKSNNGVLLSGHSQTDYDIIACPRRMSSGTVISTSDHKDYGEENCLVPVIEATHFETGYYILKDNKFCSIRQESEDVKVPAGKAVLYLSLAAGRMYGMELDIIDDATGIRLQQSPVDESAWYDLSGRRLSGRPMKKGVYIHHGKKIVINTTAYE